MTRTACRIDVGVTVDGTTRIETIELTGKQQRVEFAADREPSAVTLDPNTWMLMDARFTRR